MLYLVISTPRPERPSEVAPRRRDFWRWLEPLRQDGRCKFGYGRIGRGAVALFEVESHEALHRLLNQWAEIIPATFEIHPLVDVDAATALLDSQTRR